MIRIPSSTSRFLVASILGGTLAASAPVLATPAQACGEKTASPNKDVPADAARVEIPVIGMTCDGCAKSIHNALLKVDGVFSAEITFESGKAVVAYDKKKVAVDAIVKAIEQAGYKTGKVS